MQAINACLPDMAVKRALDQLRLPDDGRLILLAIGKAAWQMANAAYHQIGGHIHSGIVITKYGHVAGRIGDFELYEAGHPVPDLNGVAATKRAIELVTSLREKDTVIVLLSGGGSALFEYPLVPLEDLRDVTEQLLASGADIVEMNTIRKRLSAVKGGRFAALCAPASVHTVILSDIIGDLPGMIGSGPTYPDESTCGQALAIVERYGLRFPETVTDLLKRETPKRLKNASTVVTGGVSQLCASAESACKLAGYCPIILTDSLNCEAREAGSFLASIARKNRNTSKALAYIACGETVVTLHGNGKGGRNQELALGAAAGIAGLPNVAVISIGSDGTDGPTDAAGGYADGDTAVILKEKGVDLFSELKANNSYYALRQANGLVFTGATGTNVNDLSLLLIRPFATDRY